MGHSFNVLETEPHPLLYMDSSDTIRVDHNLNGAVAVIEGDCNTSILSRKSIAVEHKNSTHSKSLKSLAHRLTGCRHTGPIMPSQGKTGKATNLPSGTLTGCRDLRCRLKQDWNHDSFSA